MISEVLSIGIDVDILFFVIDAYRYPVSREYKPWNLGCSWDDENGYNHGQCVLLHIINIDIYANINYV